MKKFAKIVAICLLAIMVTTMFASCNLLVGDIDLKKTADKLEDAGYEVYYIKDVSGIDDFDFEALGVLYGAAYMLDELGIDEDPVSILITSDDDEGFWAFAFEDEDDANDAYEDLEETWEEYSKNSNTDTTYGKSGNIIYFGTVKGTKDALGFPANLLVFAK